MFENRGILKEISDLLEELELIEEEISMTKGNLRELEREKLNENSLEFINTENEEEQNLKTFFLKRQFEIEKMKVGLPLFEEVEKIKEKNLLNLKACDLILNLFESQVSYDKTDLFYANIELKYQIGNNYVSFILQLDERPKNLIIKKEKRSTGFDIKRRKIPEFIGSYLLDPQNSFSEDL